MGGTGADGRHLALHFLVGAGASSGFGKRRGFFFGGAASSAGDALVRLRLAPGCNERCRIAAKRSLTSAEKTKLSAGAGASQAPPRYRETSTSFVWLFGTQMLRGPTQSDSAALQALRTMA